jgi:hypothetical protein
MRSVSRASGGASAGGGAAAGGGALARDAVAPTFRRWWAGFSSHNPDERAGSFNEQIRTDHATPRQLACRALGERLRERAAGGLADLVHGDLAALEAHPGPCWTLHYDGMLGPSLAAALTLDGRVLAVWRIPEG